MGAASRFPVLRRFPFVFAPELLARNLAKSDFNKGTSFKYTRIARDVQPRQGIFRHFLRFFSFFFVFSVFFLFSSSSLSIFTSRRGFSLPERQAFSAERYIVLSILL